MNREDTIKYMVENKLTCEDKIDGWRNISLGISITEEDSYKLVPMHFICKDNEIIINDDLLIHIYRKGDQ